MHQIELNFWKTAEEEVFVINVIVMTYYVTLIIMSTNGVDSKMCQMDEGHVLHRIVSTHAASVLQFSVMHLNPVVCITYN